MRGLTRAVRWPIYGLDWLLRRWHHVREFSQDERCLLRLALNRSERDLVLSDGTRIRRGELIGELHLWNEHIPPMGPAGPDMTWGLEFYHRLLRSLEELASYVSSAREFDDVRAFRGEIALALEDGAGQRIKLARRLGFDLVRTGRMARGWRRFGDFWANLYSWVLIWAFNPASMRGKGFLRLERVQLWISRETLLAKHGICHKLQEA